MQLLAHPEAGSREAFIDRVLHLGFEVRVGLTLDDGEQVFSQTTRENAAELELEVGQIVPVRVGSGRVFA